MEYEIVKFKNNNKEIDIKIDEYNKTAWLSTDEIQALFDRDKSSISRYIRDAFENVNQKDQFVAELATFRNFKGKLIARKVKHYSLEIVTKIAQKIDPDLGLQLTKFIDGYIKENEPLVPSEEDIIIYDNGCLKIPVTISKISKQCI